MWAGRTGAGLGLFLQLLAIPLLFVQILAAGIQLGFIGIAVLWPMWIAHLCMFRGPGLAAWVGLLMVGQNIVGSVFNSHLFDFPQGWTYVLGVGVAGGMVLRKQRQNPA
jgi:O-antigen ligase